MKHFLLLVIFFLPMLYTQAQFAIIDDPDGYVNLRSKPSTSSEVIRKLTAADMFFALNKEGDWFLIAVDIKDADRYVFGYMHKSRMKFIHTYDTLGVSQILKDKIVFKNKNIQVEIKTKPFDPKANSIEYAVSENGYRYVSTINHKHVWGTDGGLPNVAYEYVWITIGEQKIILPAESYNHLFEPTLRRMNVYYDVQNDIIYIEGLNSDGAGAYIFVMVIKNGKFEKTIPMNPF